MRRYLFILLELVLSSGMLLAQVPNDSATIKPVKRQPEKAAANTPAVSEEYVRQLELAIQKNTDLKLKKKELEASLKEENTHNKNVIKKQKAQVKEIEQTKTAIRKQKERLAKSDYMRLSNKKDSLNTLIKKNQEKRDELTRQLTLLSNKLEESNLKKMALNRIENEVSGRLISENKAVIEQPFSTITHDELTRVSEKCLPYAASQSINDFLEQVKNAVNNWTLYDGIRKDLDSPYRKSAIAEDSVKIGEFQNLTESQKEDIRLMEKQLAAFHEGVKAFQDFINNLNKCRKGGNYTLQYFEDDKGSIFPGSLRQEIDETVMIVPYLKKKYEDFMKEFRRNPNQHSDIEEEILGQ